MVVIKRLRRLWELSSLETELISREEHDALLADIKEIRRELGDTTQRMSDWIGELMKSELLRRELDGAKTPSDKPERSLHSLSTV